MDFYCDVVKRSVHGWLVYTETRNPGISTVLHLRPLDVHIFDTNPSLVIFIMVFNIHQIKMYMLSVFVKSEQLLQHVHRNKVKNH